MCQAVQVLDLLCTAAAAAAAAAAQVCPDGLQVSFGSFFHGSIDHFHLGTPIPEANWQQR